MDCLKTFDPLCSLASPQSHGLSVLLQLRNELITLFDDVIILLVLIIWPIRLNDAFACNTVDGTRDTISRNEFCEITSRY
jgi:hypothetical protein